MNKRKRPDPVVEQLRALAGGGMGAIRAAEQIARGATPPRSIKVSDARWKLYAEQARKDGFVRGGRPNITAWLISLADAAIK